MSKNTEKYSLEKAQNEAAYMQKKILDGVADDYSEAEKEVEKDHEEQIQGGLHDMKLDHDFSKAINTSENDSEKKLLKILRAISLLEGGRNIVHPTADLARFLFEHHPDLAEAALKVGFQNAINEIQKQPKGVLNHSLGGNLAGYLAEYYRDFRSYISDPSLHAVALGIVRIRAKWYEADRRYEEAIEEYESVGLSGEAETAKALLQQHPNPNKAWKELGQDDTAMIEEIEKFQAFTKDHPLITEKERIGILNKIKTIIQSDIEDLKNRKEDL